MKSQNDMIISAVAIVLALIFLAVFYFTKATPVQPAKPEAVIMTKPNFQAGAVVMSDKLPGGDANQTGGGGGAGSRSVGARSAPGGRASGPAPSGPPTSGSSQFTVGVGGAASGR